MTILNRSLLSAVTGAVLASFISVPSLAIAQDDAQNDSKASAGQSETIPPEKVAKDAVQELLKGLEGNREKFLRDPEGLYDLVDRVLIPLIDIDYTSQLVVGRAWRDATPEQKKRFISAFKVMLVETYGNALIGFSEDQFEFLPLRAPEGADDVTFKVLAITEQGDKIPVNLDLHKVNNQWKVYNGSVGSLSFVTNYRAQFSQQIKQGGLEQLIERMEKRYNVNQAPTNS